MYALLNSAAAITSDLEWPKLKVIAS